MNREKKVDSVNSINKTLQDFVEYKKVELYTCPFTECSNTNADGESLNKGNERKKRNERRKKQIKPTSSLREDNKKFIKNLSKKDLTDPEIKLL